MKTPNNAIYERITERILVAMEKGVAPWRKPWKSVCGASGNQVWQPRNAATARPYRGVNVLLLALTEYSDPRWLTFNQAKAAGGCVRKGERGTEVVFWKIWEQEKEDGGIAQVPLLRTFSVFNVEQIDGLSLPALSTHDAHVPTVLEKIAAAEAVVDGFVRRPHVVYGGDRACYSPTLDMVRMPHQEQFESSEAYYATLFHEFVHGTGHSSRLDRVGVSGKADEPRTLERYGREELIAEIGAAFLCAEAGIDAGLDQSAAYITNWMQAIKADPRAVVHAASAAQRAADHVLQRTYQEQTGESAPSLKPELALA